jgi:hypothetical protein
MYHFYLRTLIMLITLLTLSCQHPTIAGGESWEGIFDLPKGEEKARAQIDFEKKEGILLLPDLIPVPLELSDIRQNTDSVFFTIGFRSGPAVCKGKVKSDTLRGIMTSSRGVQATFWLTKTGKAQSLFYQPKPPAEMPVTINTHSTTTAEKEIKSRLEALLNKHALEPYLYTKDIKIQADIIPHSHPTLTLNTDFASDTHLLSTFLHEQMHWYSLSKDYDEEAMGREIFQLYPEVPADLPVGAGSTQSTYLHILICYLEYHTLSRVLGKEAAREHMEYMSQQYYTWVYETILKDEAQLEAIFRKYGLLFE